jgi:phosphoribosylanthranilate isomerase
MTLIKICGITSLQDALSAVDAGADALGFNFYPASSRYVAPSAVRTIIDELPRHILTVGVFVNAGSPNSVRQIASEAGISALQLHGDESPEFCSDLGDWYVIKVLAMKGEFDPEQAHRYKVWAFMADTFDPKLRGGTGRIADWSLARKLSETVPRMFLAGGLSPDNVRTAISIVKPYAVDACSSLEIEPGVKDPKRVQMFVKAIRSVKP